jgi:pimeloyl-ACP methyl ester carboxylesterase
MPTIDAPMIERRVRSADGTEIAYYLVGDGPRRWVMPPAMGAPLLSMKHVLEHFAREGYTIVTWDMRGFYHSSVPRRAGALEVDHHLEDMDAVLGAAGGARFVLGGWSMGVQLSLEYYHRHPARVRALVLINGPFERVLATAVPLPAAEAVLLPALAVGRALGPVLNPLSRRLLGAKGSGRAMRAAGLVAENHEFFEVVMKEFRTVDWQRYLTIARKLHDHSAAAYLREVRVPTLITAGTHDRLTPVRLAERMHREIAGSELFVVPRATHYVVTEFPEVLNARIAEFLRRVDRSD